MAEKKIPEKMKIYEGHREAPSEALRPIQAGRLKGMSDINPMWRIKALTEEFGPCGIGWYYDVDKQWLETSGNETVAFVNISLYVKVGDEWSKPIFGTGGSKFVTMERNGAYVNDEAYKMAVTDAISVACKQLGFAANIYYAKDRTKYDLPADEENVANQKKTTQAPTKEAETFNGMNPPEENVDTRMLVTKDNKMTEEQYKLLLAEINRTDSMKDVVAYAKTEDLSQLSSSKCVALLTGLLKRPTKA